MQPLSRHPANHPDYRQRFFAGNILPDSLGVVPLVTQPLSFSFFLSAHPSGGASPFTSGGLRAPQQPSVSHPFPFPSTSPSTTRSRCLLTNHKHTFYAVSAVFARANASPGASSLSTQMPRYQLSPIPDKTRPYGLCHCSSLLSTAASHCLLGLLKHQPSNCGSLHILRPIGFETYVAKICL